MQKGLIRKGLVLSVIVLFIGVSICSVSSKNISVSNDRIVEDNKDIKPADRYEKTFSFIYGTVECYNLGGGIFWSSFNFEDGIWSGYLTVRTFTLFPFGWGDTYTLSSGYVPFFVGSMRYYQDGQYDITGIAIGNIKS